MLMSAPHLGRSPDRNEAVTVLAQQKDTAHRSLVASVVFVPTARALRVGPISNSVATAVVFTLRSFGYVAVRSIGRRRTANNGSRSNHLSIWLPTKWVVARLRLLWAFVWCTFSFLTGHWCDEKRFTFKRGIVNSW